MVAPFKERVIGDVGRSLWLLYGSVTLLLLIACTNIAALLLARAAQRRQEISVRYSLGASRASLVAQLLSEALVLAIAGAAAGLLVAASASDVFGTLAASLPRVDEIHLEWRIVAYTLACAIPVTLFCGLLPALRITGRETRTGISEAGRTQVSSRNPVQWTLVGAQVALAVTLLAGAGLLVRSLQEINRVSLGFDPSRVLAFKLTSSYAETNDWPRLMQRTANIIQSLKAIPGVESAASTVPLPGVRSGLPGEFFLLEGRADSEPEMIADRRVVSASYFETMRIPLLAGEYCSREVADEEVLINRSFADRYLGGSDAVGLHLTRPPNSDSSNRPTVIRGIVGDAREFGPNMEPGPVVYMCGAAMQPGAAYLVRTRIDPDALADTIRIRMADLEPSRSVFGVIRLESFIDDTLQEDRLRAVLLTSFAVTALLLATLGVYGTLAYFVNLRRREVGLRIALGAERGRIVRQFLSQGLRVSAVGAMAGLALALSSGSLIARMLYGVTPTDLPTLTAVVALVLLITAAASLIPAFRASRLDPMCVLREE
jgi:predicted permease